MLTLHAIDVRIEERVEQAETASCGSDRANDTALITDRNRPLSEEAMQQIPATTVVHGQYDDRFIGLAEALDDELSNGDELGAAVAVDIDGVAAVDIWGGHADRARATEWSQNPIVNIWSCTKPVCSLAALILIDRGLLDPHAPVAHYWPEFAANGKRDIQVRHILSHTSGVAGWDEPFTNEDMYDRDTAVSRLAGQAPWWAPGTKAGYHAQNYGHLVGEIIRRITGMGLKEFVQREISEPLNADIQIGASADDDDRIAELIAPPPPRLPALPDDHPMRKTFAAPIPDANAANTLAWRRAEIGASNGHGNARGLVRALSPISLGGTANGVDLLTPETIERIFDVQAVGDDQVLAAPVKWGLGFALPTREVSPYLPTERTCFWVGWGGSIVVMDLDRRTTIAYTMNNMADSLIGSDRASRYLRLIYEVLGL